MKRLYLDDVSLTVADNVYSLSSVEEAHFSAGLSSLNTSDFSGHVILGEEVHDHDHGEYATDVNQVFYLDLDGASNITYDGPVMVSDIEVTAYEAPVELEGQRAEIIRLVIKITK